MAEIHCTEIHFMCRCFVFRPNAPLPWPGWFVRRSLAARQTLSGRSCRSTNTCELSGCVLFPQPPLASSPSPPIGSAWADLADPPPWCCLGASSRRHMGEPGWVGGLSAGGSAAMLSPPQQPESSVPAAPPPASAGLGGLGVLPREPLAHGTWESV